MLVIDGNQSHSHIIKTTYFYIHFFKPNKNAYIPAYVSFLLAFFYTNHRTDYSLLTVKLLHLCLD